MKVLQQTLSADARANQGHSMKQAIPLCGAVTLLLIVQYTIRHFFIVNEYIYYTGESFSWVLVLAILALTARVLELQKPAFRTLRLMSWYAFSLACVLFVAEVLGMLTSYQIIKPYEAESWKYVLFFILSLIFGLWFIGINKLFIGNKSRSRAYIQGRKRETK